MALLLLELGREAFSSGMLLEEATALVLSEVRMGASSPVIKR